MLAGIDFSIKSPALTYQNASDEITFYSFPRKSVVKEDVAISLKNAGVNIVIIDDEPALAKKATISERERSSLIDALSLITSISESVDVAKKNCTEFYVAIEGFSFGSNGNRLAQISGYQWVLRMFLHTRNGMSSQNFYTYSPMTVKATAGKGNYKKEQMIEAFVNSEDTSLRNTPFWKAISSDPAQFQTKKGNWLKPIDDIIDSYWVLNTLKKDVEELLKEKCI